MTLVVLLSACTSESNAPPLPVVNGYAFPVLGQETRERIWQGVDLRPLHSLPKDDEEIILYIPKTVAVDARQNAYVMDYGDMKVKRFNPEGRYTASYGNGVGKGPGEFIRVTDIYIAQDSVLHVVDFNTRRVTRFSLGGRLLKGAPTQSGFELRHRTTATGRTYGMGVFNEFMFQTRKEDEVVEFGTLLKDHSRDNVIILDGFINVHYEDVLYAPLFFPIITRFAPDGSLVYARTTPDYEDIEPPAVESQRVSGGIVTRPSGRSMYSESQVVGDRLYVLVRDPSAFDVYDATTGDYQSSIALPSPGRHFISEDRIYSIQDTTVVVYAVEEK